MRRTLITHRVGRLLAVSALMATTATGAVTAAAPPALATGFGQVTPGIKAKDIGIGDWEVWKIGTVSTPGGYEISRWNGSSWDHIDGGGVRIDVDTDGNAWVVSGAGDLYRYNGSTFVQVPTGFAVKDVGIQAGCEGCSDKVWVIGGAAESGGYGIYEKRGSTWTKVNGSAERIDVDSDGNPWVVQNTHGIFQGTLNSDGTSYGWVKRGAAGTDIGCGGDASVWVTGFNDHPDQFGYPILYWRASAGWTQVDGIAVAISAGFDGPWVVNKLGDIYRR